MKKDILTSALENHDIQKKVEVGRNNHSTLKRSMTELHGIKPIHTKNSKTKEIGPGMIMTQRLDPLKPVE